jgi:uncharacterized protein YcaQ
MPVLAGERFVSRVDLESDRARAALRVNRIWLEHGMPAARARRATTHACERLASQLGFSLVLDGSAWRAGGAATAPRRSSAPR